MKNVLRTMVITALVPVAVFAQGTKDLDAEVNAELDKMYQEQISATATTGNGNQTAGNSQTSVTTQVTVPLTVQSQAGQAQSQAQKQPTTIIEAAPLTDSKAERIRKNRQDAELQTEQTIVEKLEQSRLEDEKRRAEALFGDKFNSLMAQQNAQAVVVQTANGDGNSQTAVVAVEAVQQPVAVAAPVVVAAPVAAPEVVVERKEDKALDREAIRGEVSAALAEMNTKEEKKSSTYVGAIIGAGDYPDAKNVRGQYALGVEVGQKFNDRLVVAGSFIYSNYQVQQRDGGCFYDSYAQYVCAPRITDMNQYNTSALVKYQLLGGTLRPEIGALVSYNYRTFTDSQFAINDASVTSQALDMGLHTGVALELTETFGMGLDFRYMWNLTSKQDSNTLQNQYGVMYLNDKAIEKMNYYTVGVSARATF